MAETIVSFGVQSLLELLSQESERLSGIDKQVDGLKHQLGSLQSLLKDAYAQKHGSERVRNYLEDVQEIVYDAEDVIETFLLKEKGIERLGCFLVDLFKRVQIFACFLVDRCGYVSDIEDINTRISKLIEGFSSLGIRELIHRGRSLSLKERQNEQREIRETFSNNLEDDLVGVEQSVEELVGRLVENDNSFQVVSITGMGGIGKTTLARQVFHHGSVRRHFDGFAWVCVSQEFRRKDIWKNILQDLKPRNDEDIPQMDDRTLQSKVFQLLKTSRYLIVLDDVWKNKDWDRIKEVFPLKKGCWKMLLTSRDEGVGLHADPTCFPFKPRNLTDEESWNLCKSKAFPKGDESEFKELEDVSKKMVRYCGGLPLAVKVLGGLLATKRTVREWERVRDNIGSQIVRGTTHGIVDDNNPNSVNRILSLSYEDLPMQLKHCFLYLAHFPEDRSIYMDNLFSCWAAEGMIVYDESTIRETGEAYMEELVRRNMVIAGKKDGWRVDFVNMHDMMRQVCLSKAEEENFLHVVKFPTSTSAFNSQSPSRSRRLVVDNNIAFQTLGQKSNPKVRSLLCFVNDKDFRIKSAQVFRNLPLLRVLDLSFVSFEGETLSSSIGELIHLRFLSLAGAKVSHLPSSLGNLKLLLHLNLLVASNRVHVPNVLNEMLELRFLCLPCPMDDKTKLELGDLVNLEYLWGFSTKHSSVKDLLCMTKLHTLHINLNGGFTSETLSSSLRELRNLEMIALYSEVDSGVEVDSAVELVLDFIHLKELSLFVPMPKIHQFPPNLSQVHLFGCYMEEDPMPILEKLLHLKSVVLSENAFFGMRMECSKGGFPQLCALEITGQANLEEWIVEVGSMPCLHTLTIFGCFKLKELPSGLKYITSLKELEIIKMKKEWKEKLEPGGEDYYKVQHIPSVQFIYWDE